MFGRFFRKFLIPHQENDFKPHALQQAAVVGMMVLILITFTVANLQSVLWTNSNWLVSTILPAVIVADTNEERTDGSLIPLERNVLLDAAATAKAEDMADGEYFAHYSPDGHSPWYWLEVVDYDFVYAGENLAVHFTDSSKVVEAWMASPTHRDNIMNANYREIGIGTARGRYEGYDTIFVVQLFGTPLSTEDSVALEVEEVAPGVDVVVEETLAGEVAGVSAVTENTEQGVTKDGTVYYSSYLAGEGYANPVEISNQAVERSGSEVSLDIGRVETQLNDPRVNESTLPFLAAVTKPQQLLQMIYIVIGLFVLVALFLSVAIEVRRQEPVQIVYGTGLIIVMSLLFYLHVSVSSNIAIA